MNDFSEYDGTSNDFDSSINDNNPEPVASWISNRRHTLDCTPRWRSHNRFYPNPWIHVPPPPSNHLWAQRSICPFGLNRWSGIYPSNRFGPMPYADSTDSDNTIDH